MLRKRFRVHRLTGALAKSAFELGQWTLGANPRLRSYEHDQRQMSDAEPWIADPFKPDDTSGDNDYLPEYHEECHGYMSG